MKEALNYINISILNHYNICTCGVGRTEGEGGAPGGSVALDFVRVPEEEGEGEGDEEGGEEEEEEEGGEETAVLGRVCYTHSTAQYSIQYTVHHTEQHTPLHTVQHSTTHTVHHTVQHTVHHTQSSLLYLRLSRLEAGEPHEVEGVVPLFRLRESGVRVADTLHQRVTQ